MSRTYKQQNKALQAEVKLLEEALRDIYEGEEFGGPAQCALEKLEDMRKERLLKLIRDPRPLLVGGEPYGKAVRKLHTPTPPPGLGIASGAELDLYGKRYDLPRHEGEPDSGYRLRIREAYSAKQREWLASLEHPTGRFGCSGKYVWPTISREEWLEQYTQTPRPTREVIVDVLLSGTGNFSREYLETAPDLALLDIARKAKVEKSLWQSFQRQLDGAPPKSIYHHCPYCKTLAIYNHDGSGTPVCKCPDKKCKGHDRWLEYDEFTAPVVASAKPWIDHNGGPCPVRHEEVEVYCRGFHSNVTKRCWPEAVNWHWNRPGVDATPIDVLKWRRV